jgi:hypothetical protein
MADVHLHYRLSTDGAPLTVLPINNGTGEWVTYCRLCASLWIEPSRKDAFDIAAAHTYIAESTGDCKSGRAAQLRHEHRQRHGHYHKSGEHHHTKH